MMEFDASQASTVSTVAEECSLNLSDSEDGEVILRQLEDVDQVYFSAWENESETEDYALEDYEDAVLVDDHDDVPVDDVPVDLAPDDLAQNLSEDAFLVGGCGCLRDCCKLFPHNEVLGNRHFFLEMPQHERNQLILFAIQTFSKTPETITDTSARRGHPATKRKRTRSTFMFHGIEVCQAFYLFLYGISSKIYKSLVQHYKSSPVESRLVKEHGNKRRMPPNTLPLEKKQEARQFILNYANKHAIPLPGRMPTVTDFTRQQLPSDTTKAKVYDEYVAASESPVGLTLFKELWPTNIHVMKPEDDICTTCQQNNRLIYRSANLSDALKNTKLVQQQQHLEDASRERDFYKSQCAESKTTAVAQLASGVKPGEIQVNSKNYFQHYSVDYIQNILLPAFSQQPGKLYFKTGRKINLFVACNEGRPHGFMYIIDEARTTGKGADEVISMLHDYVGAQHLGEKIMKCHADNCFGQNKNNAALHYMCWRCMKGLNTTITYSFMMVGHTRFGPDWLAGLFKSHYRKADSVQCLQDVADVVHKSTPTTDILEPRIVGNPESPVGTYQWTDFLQEVFKPLTGLRRFQHFRFESAEPGVVYAKISSVAEEERFCLLRDPQNPTVPDGMPPVKSALGLSPERQAYLYKEIRPFLDEDKADLLAPPPHDISSRQNKRQKRT